MNPEQRERLVTVLGEIETLRNTTVTVLTEPVVFADLLAKLTEGVDILNEYFGVTVESD